MVELPMPINVSERELNEIKELALSLSRSGDSPAPGVLVHVPYDTVSALYVVLLCGIAAIEDGLVEYDPGGIAWRRVTS